MLENVRLKHLLVIDIETVPMVEDYTALPEELQKLWQHKAKYFLPAGEEPPKDFSFFDKAGIYSEFGKIVCISVGMFFQPKDKEALHFRLKSLKGDDESQILVDFFDLLKKFETINPRFQLCGHNIKEFDIPYLCRRCLIHTLALPAQLDIAGKKPWEVNFVDTMELWKFGDRKNYTSLSLLTNILNVPTPKDDIDGSDVGRIYWKEKDVDRIAVYCQKDVLAVAQLILRFKGMDLIPEEQVVYA